MIIQDLTLTRYKKKNSLVDKQRYKKFVISEIRCIFATD